jgi:hypothetical protein
MAEFIKWEITAICKFFNVPQTKDTFELNDNFMLEDGSVDHPNGDKLEVTDASYIVFINAPDVPLKDFIRTPEGLQEALHYITTQPN